ncbi:ATP-binding protein [Streptomyces sp. NPDC003077]|uniref:ATP-binding protein n=1 Tax=Streptomyces sp. NPDC003077 TaxID=3154443 RepID=UPI0033B5FB18
MTGHALAIPAPSPSDPSDDWEYALRIARRPFGPGIARAHVRTVLGRHGITTTITDNAELLVSELTTNSLQHSSGPVDVHLSHTATKHLLRLAVWDDNPKLPVPIPGRIPDRLDAEHGRGLWFLRMCADNWGHYVIINGRRTTGGKEIWAEWATG